MQNLSGEWKRFVSEHKVIGGTGKFCKWTKAFKSNFSLGVQ